MKSVVIKASREVTTKIINDCLELGKKESTKPIKEIISDVKSSNWLEDFPKPSWPEPEEG